MVNPAIQTTIMKIVLWLCGEKNDRIDEWLNNDEQSYSQMKEFINRCAANGWVNIEESPFDFADEETIKLSEVLYHSAMKYFGGGKR